MSRIACVMLDWAGTTVDFGSRAPAAVFVEIFRRKGVEITEAEAREPMGRAKRDHIDSILKAPRVAAAWIARHGRAADANDIDAMYEEFLPLQKSVLAQHCDVIEGIPAMTAELRRRGIKIASSTGYTRELMDIVAPIAADRGYAPDLIMCADDGRAGRPAPWMIFRAMEALDVYPASSMITVDDTPIGIEAGLNAGTWTVAITRTGNGLGLSREEAEALGADELKDRIQALEARFRAQGAHFVLESAADLTKVLDQLDAATEAPNNATRPAPNRVGA